jgi:GNAT superfamily N-acetyltransferase
LRSFCNSTKTASARLPNVYANTTHFFLAREDGVDCAYGAGVLCGNGMGMVEDLFTLPTFRSRGIATALIARAIAHVCSQGAEQVLIGALTTEPPKRLYVALGFVRVCVTQEYIRHT